MRYVREGNKDWICLSLITSVLAVAATVDQAINHFISLAGMRIYDLLFLIMC